MKGEFPTTGTMGAVPDGKVFTTGPNNVPPEARAHTTVIVGNTGSGKSSSARGSFVEPLIQLAGRRGVIIDPTGVWWGLRFTPDGGPGLRVPIVGGLYGDVPLHEGDAVSLANWIGARDSGWLIIDVSEMTIGERHDFATDFFAQLYKSNRRPLALIVDEADEFAPQNPLPETKRMLHHFDRIVRRGRTRGFRPMMITQRPSVLHKNVMSQASALVAMRLLGSQDRAAVELWIKGQGDMGAGKEVLNTLARLQVGEGWLWVPGLGVLNRGRFPMFATFDSMRTPKDDEPAVEPPGPFPYRDDFEQLLAGVTDVDAVGEDEDEDEEVLRTVTEPDPARIAQAEKIGYEKGHREGVAKGYKSACALIQGRVTGVLEAGEQFIDQLRAIERTLRAGDELPTPAPTPEQEDWERNRGRDEQIEAAKASRKVVSIDKAKQATKRLAGAVSLHPAAEKLLQALASVREAKKWSEICVLAGLAYANGHFYSGRKCLLDHGLADETASQVIITAPGLKLAGGARPPLSRDQIMTVWGGKLRPPGGVMFHTIGCSKGMQMTKAQLASTLRIKPDNGHWYSGVKAIKDAGLVEQEGDVFRATPIFRQAPDHG